MIPVVYVVLLLLVAVLVTVAVVTYRLRKEPEERVFGVYEAEKAERITGTDPGSIMIGLGMAALFGYRNNVGPDAEARLVSLDEENGGRSDKVSELEAKINELEAEIDALQTELGRADTRAEELKSLKARWA